MSPDSIGPHPDAIELSTFTATIDLTTGTTATLSTPRGPARYIRVIDAGSGTLRMKFAGSSDEWRTFAVGNDWYLVAQVTEIHSDTNVARVVVGW